MQQTMQPARSESKWNEYYKMLVQFKLKNGHISVVPTDEQSEELCSWMNEQRKLFQEGALNEVNQSMLDMLGFIWYSADEESEWDEKYELLKSYKEEFQTVNFQAPEEDSYYELSEWANQQRLLFQNGKLEEEKERKLKELEFDFNYINLRSNKSILPYLKRPICEEWMLYYNRFKRYYENHDKELTQLEKEDFKVYRWLRKELRNYIQGVLSYRKIELFSEINLDFEEAISFFNIKKPTKRSANPSKTSMKVSKQVHSKWLSAYYRFATLYQENNKYLASIYYHDEKMYKWFRRQVRIYQEGNLEYEKIRLFEKIGLDLGEHDTPTKK